MPRDPLRTTGCPSCLEGGGHVVGPDRDRGGVSGDERPAGRGPQRHPSVRASSRSTDSRPWRRPSRVPDGPSAQLPRQKTAATSTPSPSLPARARVASSSDSAPRLTGLAAAQGERCAQPAVQCGSRGASHHPVHLRDQRFSTVAIVSTSSRATTQLLHHLVKHRHQGTAVREMRRGDGADQRGPVGRGRGRRSTDYGSGGRHNSYSEAAQSSPVVGQARSLSTIAGFASPVWGEAARSGAVIPSRWLDRSSRDTSGSPVVIRPSRRSWRKPMDGPARWRSHPAGPEGRADERVQPVLPGQGRPGAVAAGGAAGAAGHARVPAR